jgi:hypothetical protein
MSAARRRALSCGCHRWAGFICVVYVGHGKVADVGFMEGHGDVVQHG